MRLINFDRKNNSIKLVIENLDDLWHVERILEPGDVIEADTMRTVKVGTKEEKKHVKMGIKLENVEFSKSLNRLRLLGKIVYGEPEEFVQLGRYHTIDAENGTKLAIFKNWKNYQIVRLKEAEKESKRPKLRIIVLDDEKALTAIVRGFGIDYGVEFYNNASKKDEKHEEKTKEYFGQVASEIEKHDEKYIVAGPGFTKDNLKKFITQKNPKILSRIIFESCSYAERNGVNELFNKGVIDQVMGEERLAKEMQLIEKLMIEVNKDSGLGEYGLKQVRVAVEAFAVKQLLVLDEYLRTDKDAEAVVEQADKNKAEIVIFSSESDAGFKLKGMGKIAALLKFKMR
ncbi:MAG: mRNA surveillance protein pelota [Candidatus Micrarchaeota archaeon]|nr:mRNA surveillance protein pelota [Candidatus Micrarchaeota archaeon]